MRIDEEAFGRSLRGLVAGGFRCEREGAYLVVTTPLLYGDGDSIRVYLQPDGAGDGTAISDLGDAHHRADAYGHGLAAAAREEIVAPLGLSVDGAAVYGRFGEGALALGALRVAQGAALVEAVASAEHRRDEEA